MFWGDKMDESESIKAGDVVTLKSGGPEITVGPIDETNKTAMCYWFVDESLQSEVVPVVALEKE